ncbi:probable serine/threonine-protein kinase samkC [Tenebrio molitor]|uniref:probable serine/threonine-protein kinase samkC n=1 Tax=Tenebrio molitor TaxID=7067 RepID=UPI0036249392
MNPKTQRLATQPEFLPKKPEARATLRTYTLTGVHNPSSSTNKRDGDLEIPNAEQHPQQKPAERSGQPQPEPERFEPKKPPAEPAERSGQPEPEPERFEPKTPPEKPPAEPAERSGKQLDDDLQLPAAETTAEKHPQRQGNSHFQPLSHQNQTVNSSHDHHNHNTIQHLDDVNHDSQQHPVHNTRKKSHHENNLLMQNVDISADYCCHNRTQLFNNVNHNPQDLLLITIKNTRSRLNCGVRRNHNMIQPSKYVNDDPPNMVFVKLQNTKSSSASVTPTWWKPSTDGRSHYVDRLRPDNHHQHLLLEEGKSSVAPNRQKKLLTVQL